MTNNGKQRTVTVAIEAWAFETPFRITGYTFSTADIVHVTITQDGKEGRGEAAGVYYLDESGESMRDQILSASTALEDGASREELRQLLPAGGARNAVDCALWDLEAKLTGKSIWELTGVEPGHTHSVMTVGIDTPAAMAEKAAHLDSSKIKVKLSGENPLERIAAVRAARPDAEIIVDVNQGWNFGQLVELAPKFVDLGIAMIEQPLPRGGDAELEGYEPPITLCADESCLDTSEFEQAARRYQMINIKLDKTGGLTEALDLAAMAKDQGIELMVGNMMGTSLAMAPGFVIAQLCRFVDLDGPLFLSHDRKDAITYTHGVLSTPTSALWG
jgi:L-alanine-DL-glutamate epimerase-like enolase superfamily enzyme